MKGINFPFKAQKYTIFQKEGLHFNIMPKKKYFLTLDTETATLPFAYDNCGTAKQKQKVAIAKPLVYDIGWTISDRQGNITKKENFLVQETFFVPNVFNTAYYKEKRPVYMRMLQEGSIKAKCWNDIVEILLSDLRTCDVAAAYNATFDFKKAIPFTEDYISHLYSDNYNEWEKKQKYSCKAIAWGEEKKGVNSEFLTPFFELRGEVFPIIDLWSIACKKLINIDKYRNYCLENELLTESAQYFKSSAETAFQYLMNKYDFLEAHTALDDAEIETAILAKAAKKGKIESVLEAFPFKELGTTVDYVLNKKIKYLDILINAVREYIERNDAVLSNVPYWAKMNNTLDKLLAYKEE